MMVKRSDGERKRRGGEEMALGGLQKKRKERENKNRDEKKRKEKKRRIKGGDLMSGM